MADEKKPPERVTRRDGQVLTDAQRVSVEKAQRMTSAAASDRPERGKQSESEKAADRSADAALAKLRAERAKRGSGDK